MSPNLEGFSPEVVSPLIHRDLTPKCNNDHARKSDPGTAVDDNRTRAIAGY